MTSSPKLNLQPWSSHEQDGCANEWLKNSIFLVNLNSKGATDATKMSIILNAIKNIDLKSKLITDLESLVDSEQTLEKLKTLVEKNTQKDEVTYRNLLKNLTYDPETPMAELYSKILRLVSKSMSLDMKSDKNSIEKLSISWFLEKIPRTVKAQMQDASFEDGEKIVESAEKIRSFQKLFLNDENKEINNLKKSENLNTSENSKLFENLKSTDNQNQGRYDNNSYYRNGGLRDNNQRDNNFYDNNFYDNNFCDNNFHDNNYHDNNVYDNNFSDNNYRDNHFYDNSYRDNSYHDKNYHDNYRSDYDSRGNNQDFYHNNNQQNNFQQNNYYPQNNANSYNNDQNYHQNYENRYNNYQNYNNSRRNCICEYCGKIGHTWLNCYQLKGMISRGKISPNWEPPKPNEPNKNDDKPSDTGKTGNPLFQ